MTQQARLCVTLKLATSLDGKIALSNGMSKWITGEASRQCVHELRSQHDVVMSGIGTVLADNPQFTVRIPNFAGEQPGRVILDTRLRCPSDARLFETGGPLLILAGADAPSHLVAALEEKGAKVETLARYDGPSISLKAAIERVQELGGERIMIEAGGRLAASAIKSGLVSRIEWFRSPLLIGGDGQDVMAALGLERLDEAPMFRRLGVIERGDDLHETYERIPC